eukprot:1111691-Amphidinium_carterae.2
MESFCTMQTEKKISSLVQSQSMLSSSSHRLSSKVSDDPLSCSCMAELSQALQGMDVLLGSDEDEPAPNKMQLIAGGELAWMCAAISMVVPAVAVAGKWVGALESARIEKESKVWKLATANSTCWTSMCTQMAAWGDEGPDIIFQQEHHKLQE